MRRPSFRTINQLPYVAGTSWYRSRPHDVTMSRSTAPRRQVNLTSGRFPMIKDGIGFSLVPWKPHLERHLGKQVSGVVLAETVGWNFGRKRALGIN